MDQSWRNWTEENLQRNCDPQEILGILLKQNFQLPDIRQAMGIFFPEHSQHIQPFKALNGDADLSGELAKKREALVKMQRSLAALNPRTKTVERRSYLSRAEFLEQYYAANRPVILCGLMNNWKAMQRWTPEYFKSVCGNEMVEVMLDRDKNPKYEMEYQSHSRPMRFAEYADMVVSGKETNDYYLVARSQFFQNPVGKPLLPDFEPFPEYLLTSPPGIGALFWFGPKGTVTPLHHDLINIFMAQVRGRKHIKLVPATELDLVYNHQGVYSLVDCEKPDYAQYPKFRDATVMDVELAPGEVLFVPVGWWHHVRALDMSITISFTNFIFPNHFEWSHPGGLNGADGRYEAPKDSGAAAANGHAMPQIDHKALCALPFMRLKKKSSGVKRVVDDRLQLFTIGRLLSDEECDALIGVINNDKLRPSTTTVYTEGFRTSFTSDLSLLNIDLVRAIDEKIAKFMGIRLPYSEGLQAQKYAVGQEFKAHTDYFEPGTKEFDEHAGIRGNRTWTCMVYLNDTPKGGGTRFTKIGKTFYPKKGMALAWNNLYESGRPNPDTMHWGMPVEEGEKIIITKWFRERGTGAMFYDGDAGGKRA